MIKYYLLFLFLLNQFTAASQYAPQVGKPGNSAIYKDSSAIKAWATKCSLKLGWQNIADTTLGKVSVGDSLSAVGKAGNGVVSLGDGGEAILTFANPIKNGPGFDFAIFENGFYTDSLAFLELAFVEVSSNGWHYVRFPAICNIDTVQQLNYFGGMDASKINNLAGKYIGLYGTPFDLEIFASLSSIDINHITHIKIIDVVGSIQNPYGNRDSNGHLINDPWPTAFPSSGFDLDAVAVIHENNETTIAEINLPGRFELFPNPLQTDELFNIISSEPITHVLITDCLGKQTPVEYTHWGSGNYTVKINLSRGIYFIKVKSQNHMITQKLYIQ
ncbi:MAG: T9SS type A sorting domain-containing protein [Bacteroidota bacterium]|nr:T9SS type A sorting domain-containing protein [Bacteroidota bacterium]